MSHETPSLVPSERSRSAPSSEPTTSATTSTSKLTRRCTRECLTSFNTAAHSHPTRLERPQTRHWRRDQQTSPNLVRKRIDVRVEHVMPSRCAEEFRQRKIKSDQLKAEAKAKGDNINTKRKPEAPKPGFMVEATVLETVTPIPYDVVNDLKGRY